MKLKEMKQFISEVGVLSIVLAIFCITVIGFSIADGWSEPSAAPPGGNVGAPINTGSIPQNKTAQLGLTGGGAWGTGGLRIGDQTLNSNNNGWLYLGGSSNNVYGGRGFAADSFWANNQICLGGVCKTAWPEATAVTGVITSQCRVVSGATWNQEMGLNCASNEIVINNSMKRRQGPENGCDIRGYVGSRIADVRTMYFRQESTACGIEASITCCKTQ